mgnify:CR=1 FL=1
MKHLLLLILLLAGCGPSSSGDAGIDVATAPWEAIEAEARGQRVNLMMWMGDPFINEYMRGYVAPALMERYGIDLTISSGQGKQVVSLLMTEIEAGKAMSDVDMAWINGETFYQLRQIDALYGPFVDRLPNARYIDLENPFIGKDFQQPVEGFEAPWGNVQFALIHDTLNEDQIRKRGYFDPAYIRSLLEKMENREFIHLKQIMSLVILITALPRASASTPPSTSRRGGTT